MPLLTKASLKGVGEIEEIAPDTDLATVILRKYPSLRRDALCVLNITELERKYNLWKESLPMVTPYYAIKCNPHPLLCRAANVLGAGFDCASPEEIRRALEAGADYSSIIFANPQKAPESIRNAYQLGVNRFTFDSEHELRNILANTPPGDSPQLVLRLLPPDESSSVCKFGVKFGANEHEARRLVLLAKKLNVSIKGLSFHVGSGCTSTNAFKVVIQYAGTVAQFCKSVGFELTIFDIGGGFVTEAAAKHFSSPTLRVQAPSPTFTQICATMIQEIEKVRPHLSPDVQIIGEPGRFFASDAMTLGVRIYGRRVLFDQTSPKFSDNLLTEEELFAAGVPVTEVKYYCGDGVYGYFNAIFFDHIHPHFRMLTADGDAISYDPLNPDKTNSYPSYVFGPTCDSLDCLIQDRVLPLLSVGDWLICDAFGAYTYAAATEFNGIPFVDVVQVVEKVM